MRKWLLNSKKVSLTTWPVVEEEQKCGQGAKGQERGGRSSGRRHGEKCCCDCKMAGEQEPPAFPLLQITGLEGTLKEQFQSPRNA